MNQSKQPVRRIRGTADMGLLGTVMLVPACVRAFQTNHLHGLSAGFDGVGAIGRAPVGTVEQLAFDRCCGYVSQSDQAGAHWRYKHVTCNDYGARAKTAGVAEYRRTA